MRIFVYGSLRHKQGNSHWMTNAQLLGDFSIDNYQLYSLGREYARQLIQTPYGSAWMYVYQRPVDGLKLIESGDWLDRDK